MDTREPSPPPRQKRADLLHHARYTAIRQDEKFFLLKKKSARLILTILTLSLGWYFLYVAATAFIPDLMSRRLCWNINVAMVFGSLQFVATFGLAWRYARYAREVLDPLAAQIVADAERRIGHHAGRHARQDAPQRESRQQAPDGNVEPKEAAGRPGVRRAEAVRHPAGDL